MQSVFAFACNYGGLEVMAGVGVLVGGASGLKTNRVYLHLVTSRTSKREAGEEPSPLSRFPRHCVSECGSDDV